MDGILALVGFIPQRKILIDRRVLPELSWYFDRALTQPRVFQLASCGWRISYHFQSTVLKTTLSHWVFFVASHNVCEHVSFIKFHRHHNNNSDQNHHHDHHHDDDHHHHDHHHHHHVLLLHHHHLDHHHHFLIHHHHHHFLIHHHRVFCFMLATLGVGHSLSLCECQVKVIQFGAPATREMYPAHFPCWDEKVSWTVDEFIAPIRILNMHEVC